MFQEKVRHYVYILEGIWNTNQSLDSGGEVGSLANQFPQILIESIVILEVIHPSDPHTSTEHLLSVKQHTTHCERQATQLIVYKKCIWGFKGQGIR